MKIFDFFKNKNKDYQQAQQEWTLKKSSIIEQATKLSVDELHNYMRLLETSYNCVSAAEIYFEVIAPLCPIREDVAHSLLRIAMRPLFYLDIVELEHILPKIEYLGGNTPTFLKWLSNNHYMVSLVLEELQICGLLGFFDYDNIKDVVLLMPPDKDLTDFFEKPPNIDIKEFPSFDDFKNYFYSLFREYDISKDEIDRLILEENYESYYYSCVTKSVRTRFTREHDFCYRVTKIKGGKFQVSLQKSVRENPKSHSLSWNAMQDYIYIADTIEHAEKIGNEALCKLTGTNNYS